MNENNAGGLVISEDVIAKIASTAALETEGVAALVSVNIQNLFHVRKGTAKAVSVSLRDAEAMIDIFLSLKMGFRIAETCEAVQQCVKTEVQNMTGLIVTKVNVHVENIEIVKDASK